MNAPFQDWPGISRHIWETKYRLPGEANIDDTWLRVARAVASVDGAAAGSSAEKFLEILRGFRFLPGGRILAGAGTQRQVTLFNCFVMGVIGDSLPGIFDALREGALTMQRGGGVGYDFSTLRPAGAVVRATGSIASGPVSFMRIWDATCATMLSMGARRGAMMATLRCDHPDIEIFADAKRYPLELRHFNLSVQITDAFMAAVAADADWPLLFPDGEAGGDLRRTWTGGREPVPCRVHRVVRARLLWERILRAAYDTAEPGVLFTDTINRENNLAYCESLTTTNPCGEIPLPPYGACNLGSLNLPAFVRDPFGPGARLDLDALHAAARIAVRFLDNVIDLSEFAIPAQAAMARGTRRIGLGITGLADALVMLGHRYDSWTARGEAGEAMRTVCLAAWQASVELAREKGPFPLFRRDEFLGSPFCRRLPSALREAMARDGVRNSHLLAVAPAGTISLLAGNVSSGIEPIFALEGERRVLEPDGGHRTYPVVDHAWALWQRLPEAGVDEAAFVDAAGVPPLDHLRMQVALQPWVDNAISKTINCAPATTFEDFRDLYLFAWRQGLKGCTVFRPNPVRGEILSRAGESAAGSCCDVEREAD